MCEMPEMCASAITVARDAYDCHVFGWLRRGLGLVIGFIGSSLVVTTNSYYTIAALHWITHSK
jgi:hypothetical protein